jgi:hypothetical protein
MVCVAIAGTASYVCAHVLRWSHYDAGWWEAEQEVWRGDVTIYRECPLLCGRAPIRNIDWETGLPIEWIGGPVEMPPELGRIRGHNDRVALYLRWKGLPSNSLKPWEKELRNLASFFDDRSQGNSPTRLIAGGTAAVSPDGKNSVRVVEDVAEGARGPVCLEIAAGSVVLETEWLRRLDNLGEFELLWGPAGSRFVVIRSRNTRTEYYAAYDLRTGRAIWDDWRF